MPRKPRMLVNGGVYHLIARGNNCQNVFDKLIDYEIFKDLLRRSKKFFCWKLHHYCLMPNHFHVLAQIESGKDLPKLMQFVLHGYSRYYIKKVGYVGHLWQGRYKSPLITRESYLFECGRYIERNPIRAGLCVDLSDYPWSSYFYYAHSIVDDLIDEDPYYQTTGLTLAERQMRYRDFVSLVPASGA